MAGPPPKNTGNLTLEQVQQKFALDVSKATGIDPRVILAQELAEGAYAENGTKGLNFLNLRDSTVASLGKPYEASSANHFAKFHDLAQAEAATIAEFKSGAIAPYVNPNATPRTQIAGLAASGWDSGHYGGEGGPNLVSDFVALTGSQAALDAPPIRYNENTGSFTGSNTEGAYKEPLTSVEGALAVTGIALTGAPDLILAAGYEGAIAAARGLRGIGPRAKTAAQSAGGAAGGAASFAAKTAKVGAGVIALEYVFTHWKRIFEVVFGCVLIGIGVAGLMREVGGPKATIIREFGPSPERQRKRKAAAKAKASAKAAAEETTSEENAG